LKKILKIIYIIICVKLPIFFNRFYFKLFKVKYGKGLTAIGKVFVRNHGCFIVGNNFRINSNISSNPAGGPYRTALVVANNAELIIGNNVGISGTTIVAQNSIVIEDYVMLGSGVCVYDTDFHSLKLENRISDVDTDVKTKPVKICKGVFVGARSIILKGVEIGENSIIGAGSVVTQNVPPNEIWAGNPARFIRKL